METQGKHKSGTKSLTHPVFSEVCLKADSLKCIKHEFYFPFRLNVFNNVLTY